MKRGILYVMTTVVPGLIKIGQTNLAGFEARMSDLERNGYSNVTALKREFAIAVDDYKEKEKLLHEIFSKSRVHTTELFALDEDLVVQLLSSFEGEQIYPKEKSKEEIFDEATEERKNKVAVSGIPDGKYYLRRKIKGFGFTKGEAIVENGVFTVLKGSVCGPIRSNRRPRNLTSAPIVNHVLQEDFVCTSPSNAGWLIIGNSNNGWDEWKDVNGNSLTQYVKDEE